MRNKLLVTVGILGALLAGMAWMTVPAAGQTDAPWPDLEIDDGWTPPRTPVKSASAASRSTRRA